MDHIQHPTLRHAYMLLGHMLTPILNLKQPYSTQRKYTYFCMLGSWKASFSFA